MSSNFQSRILILNKCQLIYDITFSLNKALEKIEKNIKIAALYAWIVECFLSNNKKLPNGKKCNVHKAQCLTSYYVLLMQKILLLLDPWKKKSDTTICFGFEDFKKKTLNNFVIFLSNFPKEVVRAKLHGWLNDRVITAFRNTIHYNSYSYFT